MSPTLDTFIWLIIWWKMTQKIQTNCCAGVKKKKKNWVLGFIVRATTKFISTTRCHDLTWRNRQANLGSPGLWSRALPLNYIPTRAEHNIRLQWQRKTRHLRKYILFGISLLQIHKSMRTNIYNCCESASKLTHK